MLVVELKRKRTICHFYRLVVIPGKDGPQARGYSVCLLLAPSQAAIWPKTARRSWKSCPMAAAMTLSPMRSAKVPLQLWRSAPAKI